MSHDLTLHLHVAAWVLPFAIGVVVGLLIGFAALVVIGAAAPPFNP